MKAKRPGFTLLEMVIVMTILVVAATIAKFGAIDKFEDIKIIIMGVGLLAISPNLPLHAMHEVPGLRTSCH